MVGHEKEENETTNASGQREMEINTPPLITSNSGAGAPATGTAPVQDVFTVGLLILTQVLKPQRSLEKNKTFEKKKKKTQTQITSCSNK